MLLEASQFFASVNKFADLRPTNSKIPPASTVIQRLRQEGTELGTAIAKREKPEQEVQGEFPVTPTMRAQEFPKPTDRASIIGEGQAILEEGTI